MKWRDIYFIQYTHIRIFYVRWPLMRFISVYDARCYSNQAGYADEKEYFSPDIVVFGRSVGRMESASILSSSSSWGMNSLVSVKPARVIRTTQSKSGKITRQEYRRVSNGRALPNLSEETESRALARGKNLTLPRSCFINIGIGYQQLSFQLGAKGKISEHPVSNGIYVNP